MATFRKRSMNFTANEKKLLINLVKEYRSVIEDKRNDASALQKKEETWHELCSKYNSRHGVNKRSVGQLQRCWKNMKARSKITVAMEMEDKKDDNNFEIKEERTESDLASKPAYDLDIVYPSDGETSGNTREELSPSPSAEMPSYSSDSSGIVYNVPYSVPVNGKREEGDSLDTDGMLNHSPSDNRNENASPEEWDCLRRQEHTSKMKLLQMKMDMARTEHAAVMKVYGAQLQYWQLRTQQLLGNHQDT
ncbi:myb/SANT-like DNA-binding domain-containing protein 3 [Centruroides vittatus]|uniref:myb/SANT-like DNA-binding domain-containing protein 3 n=1 Tax=Centruroides vittatus TaxID=120091 RepID=UPI003510991E